MSSRALRVAELLTRYHAERDPLRLALKLQLLERDAFAFFRGTSLVFWADWPVRSLLNDAPLAWSTGDLHAENFGSFRGNNRLTYFDLNDFDEAVLAPCTFDLVRLWTSLLVAAKAIRLNASEAQLGTALVSGYREALAAGKPLWIERATAVGPVRDLLDQVKQRAPDELIRARCKLSGSKRIRLDEVHAYASPADEQRWVRQLITSWSASAGIRRRPTILHVARRIAGNGSLGVERFVVLAKGVLAEERYTLLDIKRSLPSAAAGAIAALRIPQPPWDNEAQRVVSIQTMMQAVSPGLISFLQLRNRSYVLRELMPNQDRVRLESLRDKRKRLLLLTHQFGQLLAWGQLRASGRRGSASADDLIAHARDRTWITAARTYAREYAKQVHADWQQFRLRSRRVGPQSSERSGVNQ